MVRLIPGKLALAAVVLALINFFTCMPAALACDAEAEAVVGAYLADLASGDVAGIEGLVAGDMAKRATAQFRDPQRYGAYLREQYQGVVTTVVSAAAVDGACQVTVQFAYPSGAIDSVTFSLSNSTGSWKITDEVM